VIHRTVNNQQTRKKNNNLKISKTSHTAVFKKAGKITPHTQTHFVLKHIPQKHLMNSTSKTTHCIEKRVGFCLNNHILRGHDFCLNYFSMRSLLTEMQSKCVQAYMTRISVLVNALNMRQNYIYQRTLLRTLRNKLHKNHFIQDY
jgi:hypothetical protein